MAKNKPNVIIAIPCQDSVKARTAFSIAANIIHAKGLVSEILMRQSCDVVSSRTGLVKDAIKSGATHLLFVDSDMFFPPDSLTTLLKHDKEIIGVKYRKRTFPTAWTHEPMGEEFLDKPFKARFMGTGLMLIKLDIFKKIPEPWFNFGRGKEGELVLGEDAWFVNTARDAGFDAWINPSLKIGHIGN